MAIVDELVNVIGLQIQDDGLDEFKSSLAAVATKVGAVTAGVFTLATAFARTVKVAGELRELGDAAGVLDATTDSVQGLVVAGEELGVSQGSVLGFLNNLRSASRGAAAGLNSGAIQSFGLLGVEFQKAGGGAADLFDIVGQLSKRLAERPDDFTFETAADLGVSPEIFRLLKQGPAELRRAFREAAADGRIFSKEDVEAAKQYGVAMDRLGDSVDALIFKLGRPLLEALTSVSDGFRAWLRDSGIREDLDGLIGTVGALKTELLGLGGDTFSALGVLIRGVGEELGVSAEDFKAFTDELKSAANPISVLTNMFQGILEIVREIRALTSGEGDSVIRNAFGQVGNQVTFARDGAAASFAASGPGSALGLLSGGASAFQNAQAIAGIASQRPIQVEQNVTINGAADERAIRKFRDSAPLVGDAVASAVIQ